jgi:hypothetical protein
MALSTVQVYPRNVMDFLPSLPSRHKLPPAHLWHSLARPRPTSSASWQSQPISSTSASATQNTILPVILVDEQACKFFRRIQSCLSFSFLVSYLSWTRYN